MGVSTSTPSYAFDQLYLPADCFRVCNPDACFCRGGHHSRSKYVYVERNNPSGRERYHDPMELMERGLFPPPGWGMSSMSSWRPKDWEMMSGMYAQWMANQRGITEVPWAEMRGGMGGNQMMGWNGNGLQGGFGGGMPPYSQMPHMSPPWATWQGGWQNGPPDTGNGNERRRDSTIDEEMREKIRILHDITFGSEADKQEKQIQEQMLKRLQPMIPELAKLIALQQAGLNNGQGINGNAAGMMPGASAGMPGMGMGSMPMPGMNPMMAAGGGMPGMNPMMHPLAAMGGMNPMMAGADAGMMGGGGGVEMGGGGLGRRRNRGRRAMRDFDFDDDDEDDFGGFGRGRGGRRRRRGRFGLDDDDLFGDRGGDDSRGRGPPRGPRPHPRPGNGNGGGGGAVFDTFNHDAHFRTAPAATQQPAQWTSSPLRDSYTVPQPMPAMATAVPDRILTPVEEPLSTSPPPIPVTRPPGVDRNYVPPGAIPIPPEGAPPYRSFPGTFDMPNPPTYPGVPLGDPRPIQSRHAHFRPEAGLSRPRQEEENRGEPQAGGPAGAHDITPL